MMGKTGKVQYLAINADGLAEREYILISSIEAYDLSLDAARIKRIRKIFALSSQHYDVELNEAAWQIFCVARAYSSSS